MPNKPTDKERKEEDDRYTYLRQDCFCGRHFQIRFELNVNDEQLRRIKEELSYRVSECFRDNHGKRNGILPPLTYQDIL